MDETREKRDRLRKVAQAIIEQDHDEVPNLRVLPYNGLEHLVILNEPLRLPVPYKSVNARKPAVQIEEECVGGDQNAIIEAFAVGSSRHGNRKWIFQEDEGEIFIDKFEINQTEHDPLYVKLATTGGEHYTWKDLSAVGGDKKNKLIVLDEPYEFHFDFTAKFIDYRNGIPWALGDEDEFPLSGQLREKDWEKKGQVFGK